MNTRFKSAVATVAVAAAALGASQNATGTTATGSMAVSATVVSFCVVAASPMAFGNYSSAQLDSTASVVVTCSNGTTYNVGLDAGGGSGASVSSRKMTGTAGATLNYTLYRDSGRSTIWGTTVGTDTLAGTGNGLAQTLNVYGRIGSAQYPGAGAYTDTVVVTVTY
jgi:spore coat protein U-like protein